MKPIADTTALATAEPERWIATIDDDDLLDIPSTASLEERERALQQELDHLFAGDPTHQRFGTRPVSRAMQHLQTHDLPLARERDRRHTERNRPPGCWCLGIGGKGKRYLYVPKPATVQRDTIAQLQTPPISPHDLPFVMTTYCECSDGTARAAADARVRRAGERDLLRNQIEKLWQGSGIPPHYAHCTIATYPQNHPSEKRALKAITLWQTRPRRWLYLHGPVGRGKTALACAIAREAIKQSIPTLFRTVPDLLSSLRQAMFDKDGPDPEDLLKVLFEVDLLVLDDLGVEKVTDSRLESMFRLIDRRKNDARRTIITSNLPLTATPGARVETLGTRLSERIASRIDEMSDVVCLDGPNLRQAPPAQTDELPWNEATPDA